ncbi:CHAT domain-containing protein [Vibrio sp. VB16]|uniref:CHAT domain-containing protein n=1 Tax=Vibrio sp. VB16 TaxID=2785746 RepID=UPI00189CCB7A|nr:CHAT domain-containing tetratricopeptide repeat protein [Vibrio sp. VB16]UGA56611.1 CHAT domain-containing protein [Vibrio sp. VB16]
MRILNSLWLLSLLSLSGCSGMMAAYNGATAMQNGTQAEYIESVGGKSAFEKLSAMELSMLCSMYATTGKINTFHDCTEIVIRRFKNDPDPATHFIVVSSHESMVLTLNGLGRYEDADDTIDRGLALLDEMDLREDDRYGPLIKTSEIQLYAVKAVVAHELGDTIEEEKALTFVEESMPWLDQQKKRYREKTSKTLSQVYLALGEYDRAAYFAGELPDDEPSDWDNFEKAADAVTTFGLSLVIDALADDQIRQAEQKAKLAFDIRLYFIARADLEGERYDDALDNFKALEGYTSISKDFNLHWMYWYDYGRTHLGLGDTEQALAMLEKSIDVIESQRTDFHSEMGKMGFAQGKQQAYALMIMTLLEVGANEKAFDYVERSKARALIDLLAARENLDLGADQEANDYLAQLQQVESRIPMSIEPVPEDETRGLIRVPKSKLRDKYPELTSLISVDTQSSEQVGLLLNKNEMLVEYYLAGDNLIAFVIEDGKLSVYPLNGKNLSENIRTYRSALMKTRNEWIKPSKVLYVQLIRPFGSRVKNKSLVIVPHGPLHYLPFSSLYDGRTFMVDKSQIRLMPSASAMNYVGHEVQDNKKMMILGNPELTNPEANLPGAEKEAKAIAALWSDVDIRVKDEATETALKNNAGDYSMFHFASHGVFDPNNPLESSLLLSPDQQNDGRLTVAEIYGIRINADLVTLSACDTGLGDVVNGDDVVGLNRGFLYAGADSILASLWPVEDEPTAYFMQSFYGYLKNNDKVDALQLAQLKTRKKYRHPSRWAAFQLTGASK